YFYTVARVGSIARAADELQLTQPTISEQIRLLEKSLGCKLFDRVGRSLLLTDTGRSVFEQAEKIFLLGADLTCSLKARPAEKLLRIAADPAIPALLLAEVLRREKSNLLEVHYADPHHLPPHPDFDRILTLTRSSRTQSKPLLDLPTVFLSKSSADLSAQRLLLPTADPLAEIERYLRAQKIKPAIAGRFPSFELILALVRQGLGAC